MKQIIRSKCRLMDGRSSVARLALIGRVKINSPASPNSGHVNGTQRNKTPITILKINFATGLSVSGRADLNQPFLK